MQRMLVLRAFRPDRTMFLIRKYVEGVLGLDINAGTSQVGCPRGAAGFS